MRSCSYAKLFVVASQISSKADSKGAARTGPHQIKVCGQHIHRGSQEIRQVKRLTWQLPMLRFSCSHQHQQLSLTGSAALIALKIMQKTQARCHLGVRCPALSGNISH